MGKSYKVPTYEVEYHDDDYGYEHKYKRSVYGYGDDSYGKSYKSYGGDSYGKTTYSSYKPSSYRYKRDLGGGQDVSNPEIMTLSYSFSVQGIRNARRDVCKYLIGGARDERLDLCLYLIGY